MVSGESPVATKSIAPGFLLRYQARLATRRMHPLARTFWSCVHASSRRRDTRSDRSAESLLELETAESRPSLVLLLSRLHPQLPPSIRRELPHRRVRSRGPLVFRPVHRLRLSRFDCFHYSSRKTRILASGSPIHYGRRQFSSSCRSGLV